MRANGSRRLCWGLAASAVLAAGSTAPAAGAAEIRSAQVCANPSGVLKLARDGQGCASAETSLTFATGAGVAELRDRVDTLRSENLTLKQRVGELEGVTIRMHARAEALG